MGPHVAGVFKPAGYSSQAMPFISESYCIRSKKAKNVLWTSLFLIVYLALKCCPSSVMVWAANVDPLGCYRFGVMLN